VYVRACVLDLIGLPNKNKSKKGLSLRRDRLILSSVKSFKL
jgi:hypothetical protein